MHSSGRFSTTAFPGELGVMRAETGVIQVEAVVGQELVETGFDGSVVIETVETPCDSRLVRNHHEGETSLGQEVQAFDDAWKETDRGRFGEIVDLLDEGPIPVQEDGRPACGNPES
jgi:hypothetical protein